MLALPAALVMTAHAEVATTGAKIRAVFVGIDKYRYSETNVPGAGFKDLRGAVGDAGRIKAALRTAYGLDLDEPVPGKCRSENAVSITLTDDCADRDGIMGALDRQIAASASGDTLLFYYAGHGSQFIDNQAFDQASGYNDTILPTDAREPGATSAAEILDREMLEVVNRATRRGINVVTIFDSCNSGSATRDVLGGTVARSVPPLRAPAGATRPRPAAGSSLAGPGYRVHLAAAADGESALEAGSVGERAGVFTQALATTLLAMPQASFADIDAEVRLKVEELGHARQHPQASGALQARLGGAAVQVALLDARPEGDAFVLQGGLLSGVTEGSTYALFGSTSEALDPAAKPVATGRVTAVEASVSTLVPDRARDASSAALPRRLVARETAHAFGQRFVQVRNGAPAGERRTQVERAIAAIPVARLAEPAQLTIAAIPPGTTALGLYAQDGRLLAELGDPASTSFGTTLARELGKVARVQALLALRTAPAADDVRFCIATGTYDPYECPAASTGAPDTLRGASNEPRLKAGEAAQVTAVNASDRRRHVYVLGIDEDYSVTLLLPADGGTDPALGPRQPLQRSDVVPDAPGRYRFVTIATDAPINAQAFEQARTGARDLARCVSALEKLLCAAQDGTRDLSTPRVGAWSATVSTAIVE